MPRHKRITALPLLFTSSLTAAATLSPATWPAPVRDRLEQLEQSPWPSTPRTIEGHTGLVAATLSPIATEAGMQALRQGGSAADAVIATALTQVATNLGSLVSYAGVLGLVYYDAHSGKVYSLDAGWNSYLGEHDPLTIPNADVGEIVPDRPVTSGAQGRKTLVPGFMAGIDAIHKRFGKLPRAELFEPAIWYATNGVRSTALLTAYLQMQKKALARTEEGRHFLELPKVGDRLVQADLAKLLTAVASHGAAVMYTGDWGQNYVKAVRRDGGHVTAEDMKRYAPAWEEPLRTEFGSNTVYGPGEHGAQSLVVLETLNLLDAQGVPALGHYWEDARAFAAYAHTLQFATIGHYLPKVAEFERAHGLASTPLDRLTPRYAQVVAPALAELADYTRPQPVGHHSASVVAVDRWGNVAALVHSINSSIFGDTGIVVQGVPIAGAAGIYQSRLATLKPGERLPGDMAPLIVVHDGKPIMAVATVGVSLTPDAVRIVASAPQNANELQQLLAAPPLLLTLERPADPLAPPIVDVPQGAYRPEMLDGLGGTFAIKVKEISSQRVLAIKGTSAVALLQPNTATLQAAEQPGVVVFAAADR